MVMSVWIFRTPLPLPPDSLRWQTIWCNFEIHLCDGLERYFSELLIPHTSSGNFTCNATQYSDQGSAVPSLMSTPIQAIVLSEPGQINCTMCINVCVCARVCVCACVCVLVSTTAMHTQFKYKLLTALIRNCHL